jgi:transposase
VKKLSSSQQSLNGVKRRRTQKVLAIGLDLGDRHCCYCALDSEGEVIKEARVSTTKKAVAEAFGSIDSCRIALEVGTHSPWISRLLQELTHEVIVANPRQVQLITASSRKDDRLDARTLARLARIDPELLRPIQHRSNKAHTALMIIRVRSALVEARTSLVNTARGLAKALWRAVTDMRCRSDGSGASSIASGAVAVSVGAVAEGSGRTHKKDQR